MPEIPVAIARRYNSLAELREAEPCTLMSAPLGLSQEAVRYLEDVEVEQNLGRKARLTGRLSGNFSPKHALRLLDKVLPVGPGRQEVAERLLQATDTCISLRKRQNRSVPANFIIENRNYLSFFNWHSDSAGFITLRGTPTCWQPEPSHIATGYNIMEKYDLNVWTELWHSTPVGSIAEPGKCRLTVALF